MNLCWLYCPGEVIRRAYRFLNAVHTDAREQPAEVRELAAGELVTAIRRDLLSKRTVSGSNLDASDFRHLDVA